jgi:hypothetical protein
MWISSYVIDGWIRSLLRHKLKYSTGTKQFKDLTLVILQVSKHTTFCRTNFHAGRNLPLIDSMETEVTFRSNTPLNQFRYRLFENSLFIGIKRPILFHWCPCSIRTGLHTSSTTNTILIIHHHNAIASLMGRSCRTDIHTPGIPAMVAEDREKNPGNFRKNPYLLL